MKKFFGFGSINPPPPPPAKPPPAPVKPAPASPAPPAPKPAQSAAVLSPEPKQEAKDATPSTPSIAGKWKDPNTGEVTEFRADGTLTETAGAETINGRYSVEDNRLRIFLDGLGDALVFTAVTTNETLRLTEPGGETTEYKRA